MPVFRKIAVGVVLVSYLLANTVASSWHDHGDCCSHSGGAHHHTADCPKPKADVKREEGQHCCHHHHRHGNKQATGDGQNRIGQNRIGQNRIGQNQGSSRNPAGQHDGSNHRNSQQHCVVCDFLALAPLAAPQVGLVAATETLPEFVLLEVLPVSGRTIETHLARGPPAV